MFSANSGPLVRVPVTGGDPVAVTTLDTSRAENSFIAIRAFSPTVSTFSTWPSAAAPTGPGWHVVYWGRPSAPGFWVPVSKAVFAPPGQILFMRDDILMTQRFDLDRLVLTGDPVQVADPVGANIQNSAAGFSVSETGVLAIDRETRVIASWGFSIGREPRPGRLATWGSTGIRQISGLHAGRGAGWPDEPHLAPGSSPGVDVALHVRSRSGTTPPCGLATERRIAFA